MRKWILAAALVIAGSINSEASANNLPGCHGPFCNASHPYGAYHSLYGYPVHGYLFHKPAPTLPVYQAAPWYLYWPYDAHFQTPAPMQGMYYGVPGWGGMISQPYFPMQNGYMPGSPINAYPWR